VGLAVLLTRAPSSFAGRCRARLIELDKLVVRADRRPEDRTTVARGRRRMVSPAPRDPCRGGVHDFNRRRPAFYQSFGFAARKTVSCWRPEMLLIGVNRSPYTRRGRSRSPPLAWPMSSAASRASAS